MILKQQLEMWTNLSSSILGTVQLSKKSSCPKAA